MALVLKICGSTWENASRDKRELSAYRELGNDIVVLAKGKSNDKGRVDFVEGFKVYRMSTRPLGKLVPISVNRFVSLFTWAKFARSLKPDIISGHDLLPGLTISWIVTLLNKKKPILIYDSHEFEVGRTAKRSKLQIALITKWEKLMMKKCAYTIVVNDSIRDEILRIHKPKTKLIVVRNIPDKFEVDENICKDLRKKILGDFERKKGYILMYHGAIAYGRGIEKCVDALEADDELLLVILGPTSDKKYRSELEMYICQKELEKRIRFVDAVLQEELWKWVGAADVELILIEPVGMSYYLSLPNKLFESIQAHTPIIASDLPEISKVVNGYKVGVTVDQNNATDISEKIAFMKSNITQYELFKKNERIASEELNWEKEKTVLKKAFKEICL